MIYRNKINLLKPKAKESKLEVPIPNIQINNQTLNKCNLYINNMNITNSDSMITSLQRGVINIIVTDDEIFTRQSTVRMINSVCKSLKIKINILEAEDGVESINLVYKALLQGHKISLIFSDENMNFISGINSSTIIRDLTNKKKISNIPFYLVTAYDSSHFDKKLASCVNSIYEKPLSRDVACQLIKDFLLNNI
jgi:CheY-like chemotaxis protein